MEPIRHLQTARLRSLKMYREDLDQLVAFFQKSCATVTISDDKNRYESLDEMRATVGPKITKLDIRGERPGLHFLFNQTQLVPGLPGVTGSFPEIFNELRTEEITDEAEALFFKVKDFLLSYQRSGFSPFFIVAFAGLCGIPFLVLRDHVPRPVHLATVMELCFVAFVFTVSLCLGVGIDRNQLLLETKLNSRSFFARNREDFAKHAVTAAISGIVGGIVGWFVGHFLK